jgi:hypothetical protein
MGNFPTLTWKFRTRYKPHMGWEICDSQDGVAKYSSSATANWETVYISEDLNLLQVWGINYTYSVKHNTVFFWFKLCRRMCAICFGLYAYLGHLRHVSTKFL